MRSRVTKAMREKVESATVDAPDSEYYKGPNGEIRLKKGTTRWVNKETKKQRRKLIKAGKAPWQQDKIHGR
jgi:hypothetical protein